MPHLHPCARPLALALALGAAALPATAVAVPGAGRAADLPMLDARVNLRAAFDRAVAARPEALATAAPRTRSGAAAMRDATRSLRRELGSLAVATSALTGGTESVHNPAGALTPPAPGRTARDVVADFLARHRAVYGLSAADLDDLAFLGESPGGRSGLRMVRLEQRIEGLAVFQSETRFLVDRDGRLVKSVGRLVPTPRAAAPPLARLRLSSPGEAVAALLAFSGDAFAPAVFTVTSESEDGVELTGGNGVVAGPITARPVLFPLAPGVLVPAWSLVVFTSGDADWYAVVDGETGAVLWRKNIRDSVSSHDARFRVYVQADGTTPADSPAPQSPASVTPGSGTQFPGIAPTIVNMHTAMDAAASPNGWIDDCPGGGCTANETQTVGNNVLAFLDLSGTANVCDTDAGSGLDGNGRPTGNPDGNGRNRDFLGTSPRDFETGFLPPPQGGDPEAGQTASGSGSSGTAAVDQFRRGVVTHLFYVSNWYHDRLFALGFDEASGNFQQTNFSASVLLGNDRVLADAADGSGFNNANFSTTPDGISGRMQMYLFDGPTADRDGSLDSDIIIHELTHGLSNRLVGNAAGLNWNPARALGEGWSDFYALSLLNNTNADDPDASYATGGYATYKIIGGYLDNYLYGIRRFPYSTDNAVNPLTWADVDDVTYALTGGIAASPVIGGSGLQVHNAGEVWALSLWEVRSRVIADPAGANGDVPTGNETMLQLVTDGLKATPSDPTFTEARDALLDADCATNACANETWIWQGFADRGLGYGAATPFHVAAGYVAGHMAVRESFAVPFLDVADTATDVTIDDSAGNGNGSMDPVETVNLTVRLTNPWRGASKTAFGTTATLSTATPGVTVVDGSATYGSIPPQGSATGDTFSIAVAPWVGCGSAIDFTVTTTSSLGTTQTSFRLRVGAAAGTDPVIAYTGNPEPDLVIPDRNSRGVLYQGGIGDDYEIADLDFRVDSITHTRTGDLSVMLRSPQGLGTDLVSLIGYLTDGGTGVNITNMVIDDDLAVTGANDMAQATAASAPFTRSWLPVFNAPWTSAGLPPDPVGNLSRYDGTSTKGTWSIVVADQRSGVIGTFDSWSILVTPVRFACTPVGIATVAATKTRSGTRVVGSTITYGITLTNSGPGIQFDNAGHELIDTLPAGLTLVGASATAGTVATGANTVAWNGSIAAGGGTVTITILATIDAGTVGQTISNQATLSFDGDGDGVNDTAGVTDDPTVGGAADATSFVVLPAGIFADGFESGNTGAW